MLMLRLFNEGNFQSAWFFRESATIICKQKTSFKRHSSESYISKGCTWLTEGLVHGALHLNSLTVAWQSSGKF